MSDSILFIDANVSDYQSLLSNIDSNTPVYVLNAHEDGLLQIANILKDYSHLDAIHLVSHGSNGALYLGSSVVNNADLSGYQSVLKQIGASLSGNGDLLLYGCNVAQGSNGQAFIEQLAQFTQADIAASTDLTGNAALGGDWDLESQTGAIETPALQATNYQQVLATTVSAGANLLEGASSTFTITLDAPAPTGGLLVNYTLSGTATLNTDYSITAGNNVSNLTSGSFVVDAGQTTATINVQANTDASTESNETLSLEVLSYTTTTFSVGSNPSQLGTIISGDFNSDGKLDLAVPHPTTGDLYVLIQQADGSYTVGSSSLFIGNTSTYSSSLLISADFNGGNSSPPDGLLDLVAYDINNPTTGIMIMRQLSTTSGNTLVYSSNKIALSSKPHAITTGDFNGDGLLDLATANPNNTVSIFTRQSLSSYPMTTAGTVGTSPQSIVSGDFNGDGLLDLATANYSSNTVSILTRQANGSYVVSTAGTTGTNPRSLISGDFNGDGRLDFATANYGSNTVSILTRQANGSYVVSTAGTTGTNPNVMISGDFNGDGRLDFATANFGNKTVSILIRQADGNYTVSTDNTVSATITELLSITSGDFNGDGRLDLATSGNNSKVSVLLNSSNGGTLTISDPPTNTAPTLGIITAPNVVQANYGQTEYSFTVVYNDSDGTINHTTIGFSDIQVSKAGIVLTVTGYSWNPITSTATYTVTPPGSDHSWDAVDSGTYTIAIKASEVADNNGAFVAANANAQTFNVTVTDSGVTITQTNGSTQVTEGGATDTYSVVLNSTPTADVTINLDTTNHQVTSSATALTFTPANWNVAQTVTVTAVNDPVGEGSHTGVIKHTATSSDAAYNNIAIANVISAITDNDLSTGDLSFATPSTVLTTVNGYASPELVDMDADGDLDAFVGDGAGNILYYQNTGTISSAVFATSISNPFGLGNAGQNANPVFADIDGDGDLDAFVGNKDGNTLYYQNTGTASSPVFAALMTNPFGLSSINDNYANPALVDIDGDGDLDMFIGNASGDTLYFQNTGTASSPVFAASETNPFGLSNMNLISIPTFADMNGDGDLDAWIFNSFDSDARYFQNTGTISSPVFATPVINPFGLSSVGNDSSPTFVDINADGRLDMFLGLYEGITQLFLNLPPNTAPTLSGTSAAQAVNDTSTVSPFTGVTISDVDTPAQTLTVTVTLDDAAKGSFFTDRSGFIDEGGGVYSFSGTAADATTAIRGMVFTPTANRVAAGSTETTSFTISVNDGIAATVTNNTTTVISTSINDAPQIVSSLWQQLGMDINSATMSDFLGQAVALSSDGRTIAMGAPLSNANGTISGLVKIYHYNGSVWLQQGADIIGEAEGDESGWSVALSSDGNIVAMGAFLNDGNGENSGQARVYHFDGSAWVQQGADIDGEAAFDQSGQSVALSSDGTTLAIGAPLNAGNGADSGQVRIYHYNGSAWLQQGADINGEAANDISGQSVALSSDGSTVAIGAVGNNGNGTQSGQVRIYHYSGSAWVQLGADIDGEAASDHSGWSVALSSDGSTVAIGAKDNAGNGIQSGQVRVYHFNGTAWIQQGSDIDGEAAYDASGWSVALSSDGNTLAIGATGNADNGVLSGQVRVYYYNGSAWQQQDADIDGKAVGDAFGWSVALSADGTSLANGTPGIGGRVYQQLSALTVNENAPADLLIVAGQSLSVTDVDSPDFNSGVFTLNNTGNAEDNFSIKNIGTGTGQISLAGNVISYAGLAIATIDGVNNGLNGANLVIDFTSTNANPEAVTALIKAIQYQNTSITPTATRTISFTVSDGDGGISNASSQTIHVTQINPAALTFSLNSDTGSNPNDNITHDNVINISGLEAGATWQYSLDGGANWSNGTGTSFNMLSNTTYAIGDIKVKQTDGAGNVSSTSSNTDVFTEDSTVAGLTFALNSDSGSNPSDNITHDNVINISGLETGATWQYSLDRGTTWSAGTGTSFNMTADNTYAIDEIQVKQTDVAGNVSNTTSNIDVFTEDSTAPSLGTITANNITAPAANSNFTVQYNDANGIDASSIDTSDVSVTGGATISNATWNASTSTATYTITPPGDSWDTTNNASYTIGLVEAQVKDSAGNTIAAVTNAGSFTVAIPGFTINPIATQTTGENGTNANYSIVLNSQPSADVVLNFSSSDTTEGTVTPSLSFSQSNWNTAQNLIVHGVNDYLNDGNIGYQVNTQITTTDTNYQSLSINPFQLNNLDDGRDVPSNLDGDLGNTKPRYDTLVGLDGDDQLHGYTMRDSLSGGIGNDTLWGGYGDDKLDGGVGDDKLYGEDGADALLGGAGNDSLDGGMGIDTLDGGAGSDIYYLGYYDRDTINDSGTNPADSDTIIIPFQVTTYTLPNTIENGIISAGINTYTGISVYGTVNAGNDTLIGNSLNNVLTGNEANNLLNASSGNDTLNGGLGNDTLTGGSGQDTFYFSDTISIGSIDRITDFLPVDDTIQLNHSIFSALTTTGVLNATYLKIGFVAGDNNDYIIYNPSTGVLSYDADGNGSKINAVSIALLGINLAVTNADFLIN